GSAPERKVYVTFPRFGIVRLYANPGSMDYLEMSRSMAAAFCRDHGFQPVRKPRYTFALPQGRNAQGEYVIRALYDGVRYPAADYHTTDWDDARASFQSLQGAALRIYRRR